MGSNLDRNVNNSLEKASSALYTGASKNKEISYSDQLAKMIQDTEKMFIAQIRKQDPLEPMNPAEIASMVTQIMKLKADKLTLDQLGGDEKNLQLLNAMINCGNVLRGQNVYFKDENVFSLPSFCYAFPPEFQAEKKGKCKIISDGKLIDEVVVCKNEDGAFITSDQAIQGDISLIFDDEGSEEMKISVAKERLFYDLETDCESCVLLFGQGGKELGSIDLRKSKGRYSIQVPNEINGIPMKAGDYDFKIIAKALGKQIDIPYGPIHKIGDIRKINKSICLISENGKELPLVHYFSHQNKLGLDL